MIKKTKRQQRIENNNDVTCFQYALTVALNIQVLKNILKEYRKLNLSPINIVGKKNKFSITLKTGKSLKK